MMNQPTVGVTVVVVNKEGTKVLVGCRKNGYASGIWCLTGGKVDMNESIKQAAIRETKEETNLDLNPNTFSFLSTITEDIFPQQSHHYISIWVVANTLDDSKLQNMEPDKHVPWQWMYPEDIPEPNWYPMKDIIKKIADLERIHPWEGLINHEIITSINS